MPIREPTKTGRFLFKPKKPGIRVNNLINKESKETSQNYRNLARERKGYMPDTAFEAMIALGYSKEKVLKKLTELYMTLDRTENEARILAEQQIRDNWDNLLERVKRKLKFIKKG